MKTKSTILLAIAALLLSNYTRAQSADDGKIVIEITKEVNGEKKTFKGEYNSKEEMMADQNYQEFADDEQNFNFWFNDEDAADIHIQLDQLKNQHSSAFKFFHSDDDSDDNTFFFKHFDGDSADGFLNIQLDGMNMEEYKKKLKELGIDMEMLFDKLNDSDGSTHVKVFTFKQVRILDVADEFGKKGKVAESNVLELDDLAFFPNPSPNGRFKVRFKLPEEGELSIKVSNLEGKEVFSRYFERFGGTYSEMIDLSGQKEGIYLLEIGQGKKRVTKKIVIN